MTNIFAKAKATAPAAPQKKSSKPEKAKVTLPGLEKYAAVCSVFKSLKAVVDTMAADVKSRMVSEFIDEGMKLKRAPDSFDGMEGTATASCQLRLRSSSSPLSIDDKELLDSKGIPVGENDKVEETFIINPKYANDQTILEAVSKALAKVKGLPEDFIQHQKQSVFVATKDSVDAVFKLEDRNEIAILLPLVTTPAITPKFEDAEKAFEIVESILNPRPEEAALDAIKTPTGEKAAARKAKA